MSKKRLLSCKWVCNMIFVVIMMVATVSAALMFLKMYSHSQRVRRPVWTLQSGSLDFEECKPPEMNLQNSQINAFFLKDTFVNCSSAGPNWIYVSFGKIFFNQTVLEALQLENVKCKARFFKRKTDDRNVFLPYIDLTDGFLMEESFFDITCTADFLGQSKSYQNWHSGVAKYQHILDRLDGLKEKIKDSPWNVYFLGFDSTSRLTFMRKFPKSYKYLSKKLELVVLKRHNIVGDGTPQALLPMLTGQTEPELPNTKKRDKGAHFVNVYPFIWYNYSRAGYATLYAEDAASIGTFSYRMTGFNEAPVDHYTRNFWIEAHKNMQKHPKMCLGSEPLVKVHLDQFRQFFEVYENYPKYLFTISSVGHDDNNKLGHADQLLLDHLVNMKEKGYLDKTILVIYGDHGSRFSEVRQTYDGKMEERLPFFAFAIPENFKQRHPEAVANLKTNSDRLTTPFDIYPTFLSLLNGIETGNGSISNRGISLFKKIPRNRQCQHAGIEPHWCTCLNWQIVSVYDPTAIKISNEIIHSFNLITEEFRNLCIPLNLNELKSAFQMKPHANLLNYKDTADIDGVVPRYDEKYTAETKFIYQVTFDTKPGGNIYEVSANYDSLQQKVEFNPKTVGVLNRYYPNGHCIHEIDLLKEKFCSCRQKLNFDKSLQSK